MLCAPSQGSEKEFKETENATKKAKMDPQAAKEDIESMMKDLKGQARENIGWCAFAIKAPSERAAKALQGDPVASDEASL
jgi:hypothetical protein